MACRECHLMTRGATPAGAVDAGLTLLTGLNAPDFVLGDDVGNVHITSIADGVLHRLQGTTHQQLITGLNAPHGLAFDLDGNLLVTDLGGGGRLIKVFVS